MTVVTIVIFIISTLAELQYKYESRNQNVRAIPIVLKTSRCRLMKLNAIEIRHNSGRTTAPCVGFSKVTLIAERLAAIIRSF